MFNAEAETVGYSLYPIGDKFQWLSHKGKKHNTKEFDSKEDALEWMKHLTLDGEWVE